MAVTPTTFKDRYPEFSSESDSRIQIFIDDAELELEESRWGDLYDRGLSALTAHLLAIANKNAAGSGSGTALAGKLASRTVGSVSVSFNSGQSTGSTEDFYLSTSYGAEYWRLAKMVGMGIVAVAQ
ncbi:DUF4054 domain-containing protein [candidate division KSB1 bacterium]|nr:DUF4054 domain-containing protein [candidate division KSB1 bacterium]